jgi:toluene monooxygenase system protein E
MRRIHRVASYMGLHRELHPDEPPLGENALDEWQDGPAWQPLRRVVEEALCAYDWGESFAALCLGIKPVLDELVLHQLGEAARRTGDFLLGEVLASLAEDAAWHREWAAAFVDLLLKADPRNRDTLQAWLTRWAPAARAAGRGVVGVLGPEGQAMATAAEGRVADWLRTRGLSP